MLHTNQSHKRNTWKYATILPILVGFMLLFQIETIAQTKIVVNSKVGGYYTEVETDNLITSKTTNDEIKAIEKSFTTDDINLKINNVKRNKDGEIIAIRLELTSKKNPNTKTVKEVRGNEPIKTIEIYNEQDEYNKKSIGFKEVSNIATASLIGSETDSTDTTNLKQDRILVSKLSKDEPQNKFFIVNRSDSNNQLKITAVKSNSPASIDNETIIYLNDKKISKDEMEKIVASTIKSVDVKKGKSNGEIRIIASSNFVNDDPEILLDNKVISKDDLNKLDKNEIESININNYNRKKIIEIQRKNAKAIRENSLIEISYEDLNKFDKLNKNEIDSVKIDNRKKIIEIQRKNAKTIRDNSMKEAKEELSKAKVELEKAKAEIEKAKLELEKAKLEIAKSRSKNKKK